MSGLHPQTISRSEKKKEKNKGSLDTGVACLGSLTWGRNKQLF